MPTETQAQAPAGAAAPIETTTVPASPPAGSAPQSGQPGKSGDAVQGATADAPVADITFDWDELASAHAGDPKLVAAFGEAKALQDYMHENFASAQQMNQVIHALSDPDKVHEMMRAIAGHFEEMHGLEPGSLIGQESGASGTQVQSAPVGPALDAVLGPLASELGAEVVGPLKTFMEAQQKQIELLQQALQKGTGPQPRARQASASSKQGDTKPALGLNPGVLANTQRQLKHITGVTFPLSENQLVQALQQFPGVAPVEAVQMAFAPAIFKLHAESLKGAAPQASAPPLITAPGGAGTGEAKRSVDWTASDVLNHIRANQGN